jgi:hypothetical protein
MPATADGRELLPVACALGPADGARRLDEWRELAAAAGAGREVKPGAVTLRFRDLPGVRDRLQRLVSAERECCAFLGWEFVRTPSGWDVEITGTDDDLRALPFAD